MTHRSTKPAPQQGDTAQRIGTATAHRPAKSGARHMVWLCLAAIMAFPFPALAHVKWFAPYIVDAPPAPVSRTLADVWFWAALGLVIAFFLGTRAVEKTVAGQAVSGFLDRVTAPLWTRMDDFMRAVIACFFVAVFAVGGVYLTPDLKTSTEWISWTQLAIAAGVFFRRTMPLSALGILALWALALRDYEFFHLLDYLALGVAVAAYLVLAALPDAAWRAHRFEVLRWGVAIALMWSSLEKFAYPEWFYPLVIEKPFLTFGLPRDVFIPMAGVAEFTLGFGLIGTPLVRRLSALSLIVIFTAAVWPFGRIDFVGHALIMAILIVIATDPTPRLHMLRPVRESLTGIPFGLAGALAIFATAYWGLHAGFYGTQTGAQTGTQTRAKATHSDQTEHPHDASGADAR